MRTYPYTATEAVKAMSRLLIHCYGEEAFDEMKMPDGKWDGPELTHCRPLSTAGSIKDSMSLWHLMKSQENGITPLEHMLFKLYQLGYNMACEELAPEQK